MDESIQSYMKKYRSYGMLTINEWRRYKNIDMIVTNPQGLDGLNLEDSNTVIAVRRALLADNLW